MTTTIAPTVRSAADCLAADLSMHPRILTASLEGKREHANDMLMTRLESLLNDYAAGEVDSTDDDILLALNILTNSFGPLARIEMRLACIRRIDALPFI